MPDTPSHRVTQQPPAAGGSFVSAAAADGTHAYVPAVKTDGVLSPAPEELEAGTGLPAGPPPSPEEAAVLGQNAAAVDDLLRARAEGRTIIPAVAPVGDPGNPTFDEGEV